MRKGSAPHTAPSKGNAIPDSNPANERVKRIYFDWFANAQGRRPSTVANAGRAILSFEEFTGFKSFKTFSRKQAVEFCNHLANADRSLTNQPYSVVTQQGMLVALSAFLRWLGGRPGYRTAVIGSDVDFLSLDRRGVAIAQRRREPKPFPTCEQVVQVLRTHPTATDLDKRDRAILAFLLLTGARVASIASISLKHIDLMKGVAFLDAQEVRTKNSKTFTIWFFPVDPMVRQIVTEWITYLKDVHDFSADDPVFPATEQIVGAKMQFTNNGLSRKHWASTESIRQILKKRLVDAGQPYFHPHLFRKTLVQLGQQLCRTPEEFKAWSQNMGHDEVMTTLTSYGAVPADRQGELITNMGTSRTDDVTKASQRRELFKQLAALED